MVTVPVKQLGLRFELGNLNGKLGCSKLEEVVDYLLGKLCVVFLFVCFLRMEKGIMAATRMNQRVKK